MPNGLVQFIKDHSINLLKSENVYILNSILTLLKYLNVKGHFAPIRFAYENYDNLVKYSSFNII